MPGTNPNQNMTLSANGLAFLYAREAQAGVSNKLHWPGGSSGVTLGPGYDMSGRTAAQIQADLEKIAVPAGAAQTVSKATGLRGEPAKEFCDDNANVVNVTRAQEEDLLGLIVPPYVQTIKPRPV